MRGPGVLIGQIPEFSAGQSIKIAPNTSVPVTDRLIRIIDSKSFQRLRKVRQLSLSDKVFPSATHTRFSHALGVYNNILDYLRRLDGFPVFYESFDKNDYLALLLAGLLHDLGHYPCAHQLDHIGPFPKHEVLTIALIEGRLSVDGEDLAAMIRDLFGLEPRHITRLLGPADRLEPHYVLLKQIIDSPNDADKCDYLPRDSYFCGLDYGTGFDRERFIQNLMPSVDGRQLCVHEKGLMSVERFQLARYWMYRSVYWGHTVRAFITMLSKACCYMKPVTPGPDWEAQLMSFNDHDFLGWLHHQVEGPGQELIEMVHFERKPYKRLFTVSSQHEPEAYRKLQQKHIQDQVLTYFREWLRGLEIVAEPHHLIWDAPPSYKTGVWETFPIFLAKRGEISVAHESPIIDALGNAFLHGVRKIRLFLPSGDRIKDCSAPRAITLASGNGVLLPILGFRPFIGERARPEKQHFPFTIRPNGVQ